jgi:NAD(P)-dependent dehydrogenase (short-subunit alcohol dehydrogenase family)
MTTNTVKTILISGGTSGVGLEAAKEFLEKGHDVVVFGRDIRKAQEEWASWNESTGRVSFLEVDLSTPAGVRHAARRLLAAHDRLDAILHTTGVLIAKDIRTVDGLNLLFTINYLNRYHLTQLLLPALRKSPSPRVVLMIAKVNPVTKVDFAQFPHYPSFSFAVSPQVNISNLHYASFLARAEPTIRTAVVHPGSVRTGIFRLAPGYMKIASAILSPFIFNSVQEAAYNPVRAVLEDGWKSASYWPTVGDFDQRTPITLDQAETQRIIDVSRALTGT